MTAATIGNETQIRTQIAKVDADRRAIRIWLGVVIAFYAAYGRRNAVAPEMVVRVRVDKVVAKVDVAGFG